MKNATIFLLVLILGGCASASPYLYNGEYFMVGDSNCKRFDARSPNAINCFNSKGQIMGYRLAMSDYEKQQYIQKKNEGQEAWAGLIRALGELGETMSNTAVAQSSYYTPSRYKPSFSTRNTGQGTIIYSGEECKGRVVNNLCYGTIVSNGGYHKRCYGKVILGKCHGALLD